MITRDLLLSFNHNKAVIDDNGNQYTYGDLNDFTKKMYSHIGRRCLVFALCTNRIGALSGYVSFVTSDIVPLLLDASIDEESLRNLIDVYRPAFIWLPKKKVGGFSEKEQVFEAFDYVLVKSGFGSCFPLHTELALLFTTSGSTGSPKLVRVSYDNIHSNTKAIATYLGLTETERPITVLPMSYSYGLSVINSHLLVGATILLTDKSLMEKKFWSFLKEEKATSLSGVPFTYEILKKLRFFQMDLPSVVTLTQAGGKLNEELVDEFATYCKQTGKRFFVMYGQTEATARMAYLSPDFAITRSKSIGKAIPGGRFRIIDEKGGEVTQPGTTGELVYYGSNVSMGYAVCGNDLVKEDENKGILFTGDLAKQDSDGFYYIVGRKNRVVKLFGNRVSLDEMEQLLKNKFADCACIGVDDLMTVFITDENEAEKIHDYISVKTGIHPSAFIIKCIDSIPKNTSGKIMYSKLLLQ